MRIDTLFLWLVPEVSVSNQSPLVRKVELNPILRVIFSWSQTRSRSRFRNEPKRNAVGTPASALPAGGSQRDSSQ